MSLSSWLGFGRKKSAPDTDTPSGSKSDTHQDNDDFILIESNTAKQDPIYPDLGGLGPSTLPYHVQPFPQNTIHGSETHALIPSNPLDDVPFKLSSKLDSNFYGWTASDIAHFKSLLTRVANLNESVFNYDFSNEQSVIKEENQIDDIG